MNYLLFRTSEKIQGRFATTEINIDVLFDARWIWLSITFNLNFCEWHLIKNGNKNISIHNQIAINSSLETKQCQNKTDFLLFGLNLFNRLRPSA